MKDFLVKASSTGNRFSRRVGIFYFYLSPNGKKLFLAACVAGFVSLLLVGWQIYYSTQDEAPESSFVTQHHTEDGESDEKIVADTPERPPEPDFKPDPNPVISGHIVQIDGGNYNTCLRTAVGEVYCWGQGAYGQLGTNTHFRGTPTKTLVKDALEVRSGGRFGCIRDSKGDVYCWGEANNSQAGNPHTERCGDGHLNSICRPVPTKVSALKNITALAAGDEHACALDTEGKVFCWGANNKAQLWSGSTVESMQPRQIQGLKSVRAISAGDGHTCVLSRSPGSVVCWGDDAKGQSGGSSSPSPISGINNAVAVSGGGAHTCALHADKTVSCWGYNYLGQLGTGSTRPTTTSSPVKVTGLTDVEQIVSGRYHNCARTGDGSVYCWGLNRKGEMGDGTTTDRPSPTRVSGLGGKALYLAAGRWHFCAITDSNTVMCWGDNLGGQLGTGDVNGNANPTPSAVTGLPRN